MRLLDTLRTLPYKARPLGMLGLLLTPWLASAEVVSGAFIPDGAQKVAEFRYRTRQKYEETLKYYRGVYPPASYPRKAIINQPGIKAVHIVNPSKKGFLGLNVYETSDEVRIFIVTEQSKARKPNK